MSEQKNAESKNTPMNESSSKASHVDVAAGSLKNIMPPDNTIVEEGMDSKNKEALKVWREEGSQAAVKHMFTRPDGSYRSYAEMRSLYG